MPGKALVLGILVALLPGLSGAQTVTDLAALKGLAPITTLAKTPGGNRALASNYVVAGGLQDGSLHQSTLLPFTEQQQQALRDVFITGANLADLADGLGTTLGSAYLARAHYIDTDHFTSLSPAVSAVIAVATATSGANSGSAKFFFANATTNGKTPVSAEAMKILTEVSGDVDIFGKSYGLAAGSPGADRYGNSRPFQTVPTVVPIAGPDYFNIPANSLIYNRGPLMNLVDNPAFPSGHTTYGYTGAVLLAILVPERYQQMIVRGAEYGNDRILVGAHYPMDVIGGRTLALYDMAHLLANDPAYAKQDFQAAVRSARSDMAAALTAACGNSVAEGAREDTGRFNNAAANKVFYDSTQTYGLAIVYPENASKMEDVGKLAPEAGYLLTTAFPSLTLEQADRILTETEGPGGGFLDNGSAFGVYSRLDLYTAAGRAAAVAN